jgi:hypothetical protein
MRHSVRARHSVRVRPPLTLVCVIAALAAPPAALAAGGAGVHVDPNSPVAKEYSLPLATARGAPPESGQTGKLFGSGLTHPKSAGAPPATTTTPPAPASTPPARATPPPVTATTPQAAVRHPGAVKQMPTAATRPRRLTHRPPAHVTTVTLPTLMSTRPLAANATPAAYRVLRPGAGPGLLWMIAAGLVVVALGSAGGVALTRRR